MKYIKINQLINEHYKVVAEYNSQFILCHSLHPETPEPWVIWRLDNDGDTFCDSYFKDKERAERRFCECCFGWFGEDKDWLEDILFEDITLPNLSELSCHTIEDIKSLVCELGKITVTFEK